MLHRMIGATLCTNKNEVWEGMWIAWRNFSTFGEDVWVREAQKSKFGMGNLRTTSRELWYHWHSPRRQTPLLFWLVMWKITPSGKPEIHNILHRRQKRTELRPQVTNKENLMNVDMWFVRYARRHIYIAYILADIHTCWSQSSVPLAQAK